MSGAVIQIDRLSVVYRRDTILSLDSLRVHTGELVGVLGPNGAGKSTLLRCLLAMQNHVQGEIRVLGRSLADLSSTDAARLRRRIGYVPQVLPTHSELPLTVREVVAIGRTGMVGLFRSLQPADWRRIEAWIDRLGLTPLADRRFSQISGGEQRKTLIARAMVQEPQLLLLDEPTANLDLGWREQIVGTIEQLYRDTGVTVLLVCHELEVLPACCGRIILLRDGRVMADDFPQAVLTDATISSLYGPGLAVVQTHQRWAVMPVGSSHA